jgi:hypothetical protein
VVVPVPLDGGGSAKAGTLLREAIEKVNKGEYGDAVTAARRAIDAMGGGWASEKGIVSVDRAQRSLDQRLFWPGVPADCAGRPGCSLTVDPGPGTVTRWSKAGVTAGE